LSAKRKKNSRIGTDTQLHLYMTLRNIFVSSRCFFLMEKKKRIIYWFRRQDKDSRKYLPNVLIEKILGEPWIHSEFFFEDDSITVSVSWETPCAIFKGPRRGYLNKKKWEGWRIWVPASAYDGMMSFCEKQQDKKFDAWGSFCFFFASCSVDPSSEEDKLICSRMMARASIMYGILPDDINAGLITPPVLRKIIMDLKTLKVQKVREMSR